MKKTVYIIVQSVNIDGEMRKNILHISQFMNDVQDRMNEIVVEFEDKQDEKGDFLWECERPWWSIANFKSNKNNLTMRIEMVEREIEL